MTLSFRKRIFNHEILKLFEKWTHNIRSSSPFNPVAIAQQYDDEQMTV